MLFQQGKSQTSSFDYRVTGRYVISNNISFGGSYSAHKKGSEIVFYTVFPFKAFDYKFNSKIGINYFHNFDGENNLENTGYFLSLSKGFYNHNDLYVRAEVYLSRSRDFNYNRFIEYATINCNINYKLTNNIITGGFVGMDFLGEYHFVSGLHVSYVF